MKKLLLPLFLALSSGAFADNSIIRFRQDNPDLVFQMKFNEENRNYVLNQLRESIKSTQGIDIFNHNFENPQVPKITNEILLEEYIDKKMARLIRDTINFKLKEITTSFDIYNLSYKTGQPIFQLKSKSETENNIDLSLSFKFHHLEIDVESVYINNHSPGVQVTQHPIDPRKKIVAGKENMTLIDDIYLKLESMDQKPLILIETAQNEPAVISGEIKIRLSKVDNKVLGFEYISHNFEIFNSQDAETLKDRIKIYLGEDTKIGGIDAIEFGRSEIKLNNNINDLVNKKRAFILNLVADPIVGAVEGEKVTSLIRKNINSIKINGSRTFDINAGEKNGKISLSSEINSVGIINNEDSEQQQIHLSTNNSVSWLNNAFAPADVMPFPFTDIKNHEKSLSNITQEITEGKTDVVLSLGQDYINHLIHVITKGKINLANDPEVKSDELITNGKKGVFLILDKKEETQGKIVVDIMIKPKFFQSIGLAIATFRTKLYFPLILVPELKVIMKNNIPTLVIKVKDIDMTEETLRHGLYGVNSNLNKGINRKLVLKKIRATLSKMQDSTLAELPIGHLEGINLSNVTAVESDGIGRLNIKLDLETESEDGRKLAEVLPNTLKKLLAKKS
jgi:hypothetical protein